MIRSFQIDGLHLRDDGRTVEGRIVPFNEIGTVVEEENGQLVRYDETFLPGSMSKMIGGAKARGGNFGWIGLNLDHDQGLPSRIGYATDVIEATDGAYGTFRLYQGADLDKVRSMLTESHTGLSVEFSDIWKPRNIGGVRARTMVHVSGVAATPVPIYSGAELLSVRSQGDTPAEYGTPALDEVKAFLAGLG